MRPKHEWIVRDCPELRIIDDPLWKAAQARFTRVYSKRRGRPAGTGRHVRLVSGLLPCGVCGGSMTVVGRKMKAGVACDRFGCTAHASRGDAICTNALSVSERKASQGLVGALKEKLAGEELVDRFIETFRKRATRAKRLGPSNIGDGDNPRHRERRVLDAQRRVANLTESLAKVGWSDALVAKLREEEAQLLRLKAEASQPPRAQRGAARPLPDRRRIAGYLKNLFAVLETDPVRGREILSRFVGPVVMTPNIEGPVRHYRGVGAFNLGFFLNANEGPSGISGCAGALLEFPSQGKTGTPALWVPLTIAI